AARVEGQRRAADHLAFLSCHTPLAAGSACLNIECAFAWEVASDSIAITCAGASQDDWFEWGFSGGPPDPLYQATRRAEGMEQANLLREVIGTPFRPLSFDPAWRTPTVLSLAQAACDEAVLPSGALALDRLAVLADALEECGCDDADTLTHLRGSATHVLPRHAPAAIRLPHSSQ